MTTENLPVPVEHSRVELGVISASGPKELVRLATEAANELATVIKSRGLSSKIQGKEFVRAEGWTTLAAMMGVTPHEVETTEKDGVFTAIVELRRITDGQVIGRASAECGAPDEVDRNNKPVWANRPRYARRSMALTRATAKACRLSFSWIMVLSGYEATPAEEIPAGGFSRSDGVDEDGVIRLPGKPTSWDGHGNKPLTDIPETVLAKARKWLHDKDAAKNANLVSAIDEELERRRDLSVADEGPSDD